MQKNKVIIFTLLLGAITVLLVGWSVSRGKMYDYNYSEVAGKMESTPFGARFPTNTF